MEGIGLGDIRLLVKLMCLTASHTKRRKPSSAAAAGLDDDDADDAQHSDELTSLSTAIGALVRDNAAASQLLLNLCTQVLTSSSVC